jgi:ABC-type polysaccharide/polyol phosphate export permease
VSSLTASFGVQRRVLGALIMRELHTRYGRDNIGFLWFFGEPLIFATGVMVLWRFMRGPYTQGLPIVAFTLFGYVPLLLFRHTVSRSILAMRPNIGLLFHRKVTPLDLVFSRILLEVAGNLVAFLICFCVLTVVGQLDTPHDIPRMMLGYAYMTWFSVATALVVGALSERTDLVEKIWTPISYLMLPLSGAYLMVHWLPEELREWYMYMPTVSAFEMIRSGYFGEGLRAYWDQPYVAGCCAAMTLLGLALLRNARRYVMIE